MSSYAVIKEAKIRAYALAIVLFIKILRKFSKTSSITIFM